MASEANEGTKDTGTYQAIKLDSTSDEADSSGDEYETGENGVTDTDGIRQKIKDKFKSSQKRR